ncbi:MAG: shikimate dehydrogenase [Nocardioidaceae bacterium]|nr:shikimate dehydrogenase [Nocardioidaceae bacterium]
MSTSFVLGLVGVGIERSLTPAMQVREGEQQGLSVSYRIIDGAQRGFGVDDLPDVLAWAERLGFDGLNVTHPFKQAVVPLLDDLSQDAADLGAVNTVVFRDGRRLGRNTDWSGFARAFTRALPGADDDPVVLVGAGGAGVAVGYGLLAQGAGRVSVFDSDGGRADDCAIRLAKRYGEERVGVVRELRRAVDDAGGVVNATPVGMHGHPGSAVPEAALRDDLWVADVVYFPLETELVSIARRHGCRVMTGGGMAVQQAVGAFELFTGRSADATRMHRHFEELTA